MTAGLHIYTSDDIRRLAAQYSRSRQKSPGQFYSSDLFAREKIVIPSRAMRQWLERTLADQGFFLANVEFCSMRSFVSETLELSGENGECEEYSDGRFGRKTMVWRIMEVLRKRADEDEFPELTKYLESGKKGESRELRRYSLADKIAGLFCRYIEETPELLARRESFADGLPKDSFWRADHWQAKMWRSLCEGDGGSPADAIMKFLTGKVEPVEGQGPVTVFGVGSMAPAALAVLKKLARVATVNLFCLNPADAGWKKEDRERWTAGTLSDEPEAVKILFDSRITGQWARHQRHFFKTVLGLEPLLGLPAETFDGIRRVWDMPEGDLRLQSRFASAGAENAPRGVLQGLQKKLLDPDVEAVVAAPGWLQGLQKKLLDPEADCSGFAPDDSLTIHNCHSPAREVESLRDHLLHLIQTGKYTNSEILVAAPDITVFEPYVKAVFDQPIRQKLPDGTEKDCRLSYSFSGLGVHKSNPLAETFLDLLDIGKSRYELSHIEKLLMTPEVRQRFDLGDDDLRSLYDWCRTAGIYWGADGEREKKFGVPDYENFSWRYGLDRMLLGFALEEDDEDIDLQWNGVAPFDGCDSPDGRSRMRALLTFFNDLRNTEKDLFDQNRQADHSGPIADWKERLDKMISAFFAMDMDRKAFYRGLTGAVNILCAQVEKAGYGENIPLEVIRRALSDLLSVPVEDEEFLNGGITFCNLRDARSIPCKVLCLLGMDENTFPNPARPDSFDLIRAQMEKTFRSPRFQDRYFFLESLLGVRDRLLIYYRGQDDVMDKKFSPATVITELTSYIAGSFPKSDVKTLEVSHSLLPYSHDYFIPAGGEYLLSQKWSFDRYACAVDKTMREAAKSSARAGVKSADKYPDLSYRKTRRLQLPPDPSDTVITVKLSELEQFFRNAGYVFLKNCFSFPEATKFGESRGRDEPIYPDDLEQWSIKDFLSRWLIEKIPPEKVRDRDTELDGIEGIDDVLKQCHEHLCRLNRLPSGGWGRARLDELAAASWIVPGEIRAAWRKYCESRENRPLQLEFDDVVRLPDKAFCTDYPEDEQQQPHYAKVILQHSTKKPKDTAQVVLTFKTIENAMVQNKAGKYLTKVFLRHLFFQAYGDEKPSYLVHADRINEYSTLSSDDSRKRLRKILAFYLYARRHPLPIMENCMWCDRDKLAGGFRTHNWDGDDYGDFKLDHARLLWGNEKLDKHLEKVILNLQALRDLPGDYDPNTTPMDCDN